MTRRLSGPPAPDARSGTYLGAVRRFFAKRVRPHEVDDMVQNVALRLETRSAQDRIENIESYVFQVAQSVMLDQHRRDRTRHADRHQLLDEATHPVEEISPFRILAGRDELEKVINALQRLPDRTRQAFVQHRFEELSYRTIADKMGISVSAVEKHIMRAIRQLHAELRDD